MLADVRSRRVSVKKAKRSGLGFVGLRKTF